MQSDSGNNRKGPDRIPAINDIQKGLSQKVKIQQDKVYSNHADTNSLYEKNILRQPLLLLLRLSLFCSENPVSGIAETRTDVSVFV